jgi:hypothetical protein
VLVGGLEEVVREMGIAFDLRLRPDGRCPEYRS